MQLFEGDFKRLDELLPDVAPGYVIRQIVRATIKNIERQQANARAATNTNLEEELNLDDIDLESAVGSEPEES